MKQLLVFSIILFASTATFAQRAFLAEREMTYAANLKVDSVNCYDTLGLCAYKNASKVLYMDQFGGYAVGTNFFGDLAKAQQFDASIGYSIKKVLFNFGYKKKVAADSNSYLVVNIYALNDSGTSTVGANRLCPGTILDSRNLLLDSIDTVAGHFTVVNFDWVQTKYDSIFNFAVGFDMSHLDTADRVGLYATKDSSANKNEHSWEKQSNGNWFTMLKSWPLDIDFAIFPVVDTLYVGIQENNFANSNLLSISPNPANQLASINFNMDEPGSVSLQISDYNGKIVLKQAKTTQNRGNQKMELNTAELKPGIYNCIIQTSKAIQSKKLVIVH